MVKQIVKDAIRAAAARLGPHRWSRGPSLVVLTYHRVLPDGHPAREIEQPGMLVSPDLLAMHLEVLRRHFTPLHLDDWLRACAAGEPPLGRSIAITFDDGWRDNYDHAFPILKAAGWPATIFLVTDMVGSRYRFWPNRLARVLKTWTTDSRKHLDTETERQLTALGIPLDLAGHDATPDHIDAVISACKTADDASMQALMDRVESLVPSTEKTSRMDTERDLLNWYEVHAMADSGLIRFGSHTRRHTRLIQGLDREVIEDEILESRRQVEQNLKRPAEIFCYPNGDHSPAAYASVRTAYEGAVTTAIGWHRPGMDQYMIPRISIHGDVSRTPAALLARLSGWPGL